jgi:ubiquitin C-terminal hydrolase
MNSILQCFCHIKEFAVYFQTDKMEQLVANNKNNNNKLFTVFQEVIKQLWDPYDNSPYSPYNFKQRLGEMNPLFRGPYPNDAKDLLTFMLMQLHDELNHPINNNNNMNVNMIINSNMQRDKNAMFKYFTKYFTDNFRSIISALFYGLNYNQTQCQFCKSTVYNYQTFNFLIFPLFEVLNYKIKSINFQTNFNSTVTLVDCFDYNQSHMILNEYYCNACRRNSKGRYTNFLSALPNIIIIILNRGVGLQYKVKIDFDENIDLRKYVDNFKDNSFYELIGVVTHYGESGANGHFMARCKSPLDNFWYLYNDAIVQKIGYFTKEKFLQGNPYILFYKRANIKK